MQGVTCVTPWSEKQIENKKNALSQKIERNKAIKIQEKATGCVRGKIKEREKRKNKEYDSLLPADSLATVHVQSE